MNQAQKTWISLEVARILIQKTLKKHVPQSKNPWCWKKKRSNLPDLVFDVLFPQFFSGGDVPPQDV